jgi:YbbR domain-containing protein
MLDRVLKNWPLKLLALALSYAVWVAVTAESRLVQDVPVPLDVELAADRILGEPPPPTVLVRMRGPEDLLSRSDFLRVEMRVDLREAAPGPVSVQLDPRDLTGLPRGVEVGFILPDRLTFVVDRRGRRTVPVVASFRGKPPAGYAFYGARAIPETQEVDGPAGDVAALERLRTDPIQLEGRTAPFTVRVRPVPDNPAIRLLDPRPVEVRVEVDQAPVRKVVDVPVVLVGQTSEASVVPAMVQVTLAVPPHLARELGSSELRAVVDVTGLAPGLAPGGSSHDLPVRVEFTDAQTGRLAVVESTSAPTVRVRLSPRGAAGGSEPR